MAKKATIVRIHMFLGVLIAVFGFIGHRLFVLGYTDHAKYARTAIVQTERVASIMSRGGIFITDKQGTRYSAATNKKFPVTAIVASRIDQARVDEIAQKLSAIIGVPPGEILEVMKSGKDALRNVGPRLTDEQAERVKGLAETGVSLTHETDRFYPNESLGADVLGFLGYEGDIRTGQYGVESSFNGKLSGKDPSTASGSFNLGSITSLWSKKSPTQSDPHDVVLTIDKNIQTYIEDTLDDTLRRLQSTSGSIIVQEPTTGKILAMTDRPSFNPNTYGQAKPETFLNTNVQAIFEPGSSFKPVTMAIGLELGKITPDTKYTDPGVVEVAGYPIRNFDGLTHGVNTMTQVLEKSLNTGTMFVENKIGDEQFRDSIINMGFGQRTGIDLPGEVNGDITNLYSGRKVNYLTASFGQGIAVTPIQLITVYSAIANGGKLMRPYVVGQLIQEDGSELVTKPEVAAIPISEKTAYKLQSMLVSVVDKGFDKARIKGYDVAGKTGTAQMPDGKGGYSEDEFIHNFLGFVPGHDARFVIMIKVDRPKGIAFAADSLSPVFRDIAQFIINYYNIPPTR